MAEPMTNERLAIILDEMNRTAVGYLSDEVSVDQDSNLDRYLGKPYGDEEEGLSNAISMDVAEVVDWALPDLLEPFLSGDKIVEFEPNAKKDEDWVSVASDVANHDFFVANSGTLILHDTIKSALIQKIGWTKTWWEEREKTRRETLTGLSVLNVEALKSEAGVTVESIEFEPMAGQIDQSMAAAFTDGNVYTVTVTRVERCGGNKIASVAPEEIKVSARSSDLATTRYIAHETEVYRSDLSEMGFDQAIVDSVKAEKKIESDRKDARFTDESRNDQAAGTSPNDLVTLIEEYPLIDANGDGKAERLQVFRVGKVLLQDPVEVTSHPFDCWTADRIPHRLIGLALADKVKQTQKIKTHLTRQMLNNIYMANMPRTEIPESAIGDDTIDDLLDIRIGGFIRTKQPGQMVPFQVPDRSGTALQAITYMDTVREMQSGITRNGMAVSSEVVDAKSATESRRQDRNEQVRKRLMARMIAETLLVPLFQKILRNIVTYQDAPRTLKIAGEWTEFDARGWDADVKARVSVGLGHANRDEMLQAAQLVGEAQMMLQPLGLVTPDHLYATGEKLIEGVGWRFADKFFINPRSPEGQQALQAASQQKPDPKMAEVQAKTQLEQVKAQFDQQARASEIAHKAQIAQIEAATKRQIAEMEARMDYQIQQVRIAAEMQAQRERTAAEMDLAEWETRENMRLKEKEIEMRPRAPVGGASRTNGSGGVRFGGKIG